MLEAHRPGMSDEVYKRCRYVVAENDRVLKAVEALKLKDMEWLGQLLSETHRGLKEDYEVSCAELDFLVDQASKIPGVAGARMVGGGFGGCTLNLVRKENSEAFKHQMVDTYCRTFGVEPDVIQVGIGPGVGIPI
jgi:galactokinase